MLCGQLDRRRVGHRCAPCKKSHVKCDGGRPCSSCLTRGLECVASTGSSHFHFVQRRQPARVPRVLVQDSWRYISTYFRALGSLTQASVLRSPAVTALSHEDENVSRSLSIVGAFYACRNPQVLRVNAKERRDVTDTWTRQKSAIENELKKPETARFTAVLLSSLLLAAIELMVVQEEGTFQRWLSRISGFIKAHKKHSPTLTPFESDLVRFFRFLDILSSISRHEIPVEPQVAPEPLPAPPVALHSPHRTDASPTDASPNSRKVDAMLSALWQWAVLQERMMVWEQKTSGTAQLPGPSHDTADKSKESVDLRVQGLDIICEVSALQSRMIANLMQLSQEPQDHASVSISPYYHWALTGLSHKLKDGAWSTLMCDLPILPSRVLHEQALTALGCVETLIDRLGLDLALYLPFADFVGQEMQTDVEQRRMLKFLDTVHGRGFEVANEYRDHLLCRWKPGNKGTVEPICAKMHTLSTDHAGI
ncbi:hypothetical protein C8034_v010231 [Colletotrichum sidae]|uniref:Zn(2)-C6 fungal-type domain-containing protein n=1 Tax=Colletotrichum sidae TaxID=1347389 RepID=A0A4R8TM94_9PEZI|nr:hypothetical protein C8034_v010231 [Colletotrichum sidae]